MADLLEVACVVHLELPGAEDRVVEVDTEHAVGGHLGRGVGDVDVVVDILAALPLVDVDARCGGQDDVRLEEVELGKCLVAGADALGLDVLHLGLLQSRIVLGCGHVHAVEAAGVELSEDRFEDGPVTFVIGENGQRDRLIGFVCFLTAAQEEAELDPQAFKCEACHAEKSDQDSKKHGTRARVDIESSDCHGS